MQMLCVLLACAVVVVADTEYAEAAVNVAASAFHVDADSAYELLPCRC